MKQKAQAALEYLMTYGWALILIAVVAGVLIYVTSSSAGGVTCQSKSQGIILKESTFATGNDTVGFTFQNASGNSITLAVDCVSETDGSLIKESDGSDIACGPASVAAGGEFTVQNLDSDASGSFSSATATISYTTAGGLPAKATITCSGTVTGETEECQLTEETETTCNDSIDNDCDGATDCSDTDCDTNPACAVEGLVARWRFSEGSGTFVGDSSGNANNGTLYGADWVSECPNGSCLSFNGTGDYVQMGYNNPSSSEIAGDKLTVEAWVKPSTVSGSGQILIKNGPINFLRSGDKLVGGVHTNEMYWPTATGNISLSTNWTHVAMVYNGSNISLYVNGAFDNSAIANGNLSGDGCVEVGRYNNAHCGSGIMYYFNGLMDEVSIYNKALTPAEICGECNDYAADAGVTCNC